MPVENLADAISSLTPEEQESVRQFIEPSGSVTSYRTVDELITVHARLMTRVGGLGSRRARGRVSDTAERIPRVLCSAAGSRRQECSVWLELAIHAFGPSYWKFWTSIMSETARSRRP